MSPCAVFNGCQLVDGKTMLYGRLLSEIRTGIESSSTQFDMPCVIRQLNDRTAIHIYTNAQAVAGFIPYVS